MHPPEAVDLCFPALILYNYYYNYNYYYYYYDDGDVTSNKEKKHPVDVVEFARQVVIIGWHLAPLFWRISEMRGSRVPVRSL